MIKEFKGEFRWLSNFSEVPVILGGVKYPSVEHAYQSAKSEVESWKEFCAETPEAGKVKNASKGISVISTWKRINLEIMKDLLIQKYNQEPYKSKLIATGKEEIQEGNLWGDDFWGIDLKTGTGKNILGQMIMEIRDELKEKEVLK
jgi:hypothetical protein